MKVGTLTAILFLAGISFGQSYSKKKHVYKRYENGKLVEADSSVVENGELDPKMEKRMIDTQNKMEANRRDMQLKMDAKQVEMDQRMNEMKKKIRLMQERFKDQQLQYQNDFNKDDINHPRSDMPERTKPNGTTGMRTFQT